MEELLWFVWTLASRPGIITRDHSRTGRAINDTVESSRDQYDHRDMDTAHKAQIESLVASCNRRLAWSPIVVARSVQDNAVSAAVRRCTTAIFTSLLYS